MRNPEPEPSLNLNLIMPAVLMVVLLVVPFSINSVMHLISAKREFNPIIMKLPLDSTVILIPPVVKQYESFEVALELDTKQLSRFLNEIISASSEGASIQGIIGLVSPYMKAEIAGNDFQIDKPGPQDPLSNHNGIPSWRWYVNAKSLGSNILKFQLHLLTDNAGQQVEKVLDLAETRFFVQPNPREWLKRNGIWISSLLFISLGIILRLVWRRYK